MARGKLHLLSDYHDNNVHFALSFSSVNISFSIIAQSTQAKDFFDFFLLSSAERSSIDCLLSFDD